MSMSMGERLCWSTPHLRVCAVCGGHEGPTPHGFSIMEWWTESSYGVWVCCFSCFEELPKAGFIEEIGTPIRG